MENPEAFFAQVEQRLRQVAQDPPYRFRDTSRAVAERYRQRKVRFEGFSEEQIVAVEQAFGGPLPAYYRCFLARMGRRQGDLFIGSVLPDADGFAEERTDAIALLDENESGLSLPPDALVILFHQGYTFDFLHAAGGIDGPVFRYVEPETAFRQAAASFRAYLESALREHETVRQMERDSGGHFLTVDERGYVSRTSPARNSGIRPLDFEDVFSD